MAVQAFREEILRTQVRVKADKAGGSGTIIYSRGASTYILTCHHVVEGAISVKEEWDSTVGRQRKKEYRQVVEVEFFDWAAAPHGRRPLTSSVDGEIVAYDAAHDMALVKLRVVREIERVATLYPPSQVGNITVGDPCFCCGCALLHDPILTQGHVTHMGDEIDYKLYWMSSACLPADQTVLANPSGPMSVAQVKPGEHLFTMAGWRAVRAAALSGYKQCVRIKTHTRDFRCSTDHPILVYQSGGVGRTWLDRSFYRKRCKWVPAGDLRSGDHVIVARRMAPKVIPRPRFLGRWVTPEMARFIGFYLAEGCWKRRSDRAAEGICVSNTDLSMLRYYGALGESVLGVPARYGTRYQACFYSRALADSWPIKGKSPVRRMPQEVLHWPRAARQSLLEGFADGDGSATRDGGTQITLANPLLTQDLWYLALSVGLQVTSVSHRDTPRGKRWRFVFRQHRRRSRNPKDFGLDTVLNVEKSGLSEPVYDVEMEGEHNFVFSGVVGHNSIIFGNSGGSIFVPRGKGQFAFIGIPSRIDVAGWSTPITHLGYFSPIPRVYEFFSEQMYHFLIPGHEHDEATCADERKNREATERRRLLVEAPET